MGYKTLDTEIKGQMTLFDDYQELSGELFAVSKIFSEARKQMTLAEYKAFTYALSKQVKWTEQCPDVLYLDKKELAEIVGIECDTNHLSQNLYRSIGEMPAHSFLKFRDKDKDFYMNGNFVTTIAFFKNQVRIRLNSDYLGLFGNMDSNYITMWSQDIFQMRSERSVIMYELMRTYINPRDDVQTCEIGVKELKSRFNIPKDGPGSYMREKGGFDRSNFEKRVLDPLCEDLSKTKMITLVLQEDGKYYRKIKPGNRVQGYHFDYLFTQRPKVATATEVHEIQEKVDKDPQVLKIAKDIIKGKEKPQKQQKQKKSIFNSFPQQDYDIEELERRLVANYIEPEEPEGD